MPEPKFENRLYDTKEAAKILRVSMSAIKDWVKQKILVPQRVGVRKLVFEGTDLQAMITPYVAPEENEDPTYDDAC